MTQPPADVPASTATSNTTNPLPPQGGDGGGEDDGRTLFARLVGGLLLLIPPLLLYLLIALWPRPQGSITCEWQSQWKNAQMEKARDDAEPELSPTPGAEGTSAAETPSPEATPTGSPAATDATPPEESEDDTTQAAEGEDKGADTQDWAEQWAPCASLRPITKEFRLLADVRLLILVMLAGALGAYVHAAQSYSSYIGNRKFKKQWTWWYILRIPVGSALALFLYFTARGGLLTGTTPASKTDDLNIFGIMSFAALAGLFSKQVIDKLSEVFSNFFKSTEDDKRHDKMDEKKGGNPPPGGGGGGAGAATGASGTATGASGGTTTASGTSGGTAP